MNPLSKPIPTKFHGVLPPTNCLRPQVGSWPAPNQKMNMKELNRATIEVGNTTDMSGTATADGINRRLQTTKDRSYGFVAGLFGLGSLIATGIFVTLALPPASAEGQGVPGEIAALKAQVVALQSQVNKLQTQLTAVQSNNALKLGPFVGVVSGLVNGVNGPHIFFTGANIHVVSGSTTTADRVTGLGNLIIGYNEVFQLSPGDRGGSHNLVIGRYNRFTSAASGGFVGGEKNTISNLEASVTGGEFNIASGEFASVSGGAANTAFGGHTSVSGGQRNAAYGSGASVSGGLENAATGDHSSVSGGDGNSADGGGTSVTGGFFNAAHGYDASVSGGGHNLASGNGASVTGGLQNIASGLSASITGGEFNNASGQQTVVIGGKSVTDDKNISIAPQPPFP
jgi:hypothetical protein